MRELTVSTTAKCCRLLNYYLWFLECVVQLYVLYWCIWNEVRFLLVSLNIVLLRYIVYVMDARELHQFKDNSFTLVIDKGEEYYKALYTILTHIHIINVIDLTHWHVPCQFLTACSWHGCIMYFIMFVASLHLDSLRQAVWTPSAAAWTSMSPLSATARCVAILAIIGTSVLYRHLFIS